MLRNYNKNLEKSRFFYSPKIKEAAKRFNIVFVTFAA